ncbi:HipA domain-containing protein [Sphingomonas sp. H39-1-10]|uniref:type II toxin-antitoxin system HipA family toxin n=1 Tax=Sphingomonas pollutisoli TaxID=3030829 RepID=UPI0023B9D5A7|nr:HipA domain-containing protein [Sphingomonas pollutisoli]MDF0487712.1 HipA domain-containing protein [Sphingomonas pollutisoli]
MGLGVAPVRLTKASGKDVLLVQRFDREKSADGWARRAMVSALTMLGLSEMQARYASYVELVQIVPRELFARMVFNILEGNTDDHTRNHAAFWDGARLELTHAYDICPQARTGREANQAMAVLGEDRRSLLENCRLAASSFLLTDAEARDIINGQASGILAAWVGICDEAELSEVDRSYLWRQQMLNDYAFEGYIDAPPAGL